MKTVMRWSSSLANLASCASVLGTREFGTMGKMKWQREKNLCGRRIRLQLVR